ncbi:unnamed protein product [Ambrosiozyma monospora]|uniref:Unnamed protein product n=1 Tax=Ambrosiozyma monospora TaxID=43982 RepID=A0ACB5U3X1_AMBMO|nr:unnamed protein product [Ambrosiozyma monospora]
MFAQAGSIISSNIYRTADAPLYKAGNAVLVGFAIAMFPILIGTKWFYVHINNKRDKIWNSMTEEEKDDYRANTTDVGSSRLDFRFGH